MKTTTQHQRNVRKLIESKPNINAVKPMCSDLTEGEAQTIQLYHHKTNSGAEYLTDAYVQCPKEHREGIFEGAKFIVRIDGDITKDAVLTIPKTRC